ncbi:MAG: mechanosensitive ion channel family protein [Frankiaceae bacterium]
MTPSADTLSAETLTSACGLDPDWLCRTVFDITHSAYLASGSTVILGIPAKIILILVVALVARWLLNRIITRIVRRAASGHVPRLSTRCTGGGGGPGPPYVQERMRQRSETVGSVLRSIVTFTVFGIAFVTILGTLGIDLAPLVASAGVIGIAIAFGAQTLVRDFLTGMFMILEDQYGVGDVVDAGPASGTVEAVGLRTTRLRDINGAVWHIRNGTITRIGNMSQGWARAVLDVPVDHNANIGHARDVIAAVAQDVWRNSEVSTDILAEPEVWGVEQLTADAVTLRLVVKTAPLRQWEVARVLRERLKVALDEAGIDFPQGAPAPSPPAAPAGPTPSAAPTGPEPAAPPSQPTSQPTPQPSPQPPTQPPT